jgi:uncharacterized protein (DUF1810 family)
MTRSSNPFGLERFLEAQAGAYCRALAELRGDPKTLGLLTSGEGDA